MSRGFNEQYSFEDFLDIEEGRLDKDPCLTPMVMYKDMGMYSEMVRHLKIHLKMFILYYLRTSEIILKKKLLKPLIF